MHRSGCDRRVAFCATALAVGVLGLKSKVEMHGKCAAVARSNVWMHEVRDIDPLTGDEIGPVLDSQPMWDYRIRVDPWQVFGIVQLEIRGTDIVVEHVWAANVLNMDESAKGVKVVIELENTPQDDQQFDIDGTGTPSGEVAVIGCSGLDLVVSDCKLGLKYNVLNSFEGILSSKINVNTWQEGAKITLNFGTPTAISEVWGAQIIDYNIAEEGEEGDLVEEATFRLLPFNHHTPLDRRSSFGFDANPPFHQVPIMTCLPSHPLPPPPPPLPPVEPPSPPPFFVTERADCFLGGRITFTTPPSDIPGTLWAVNVKMNHWQPGAQLTIDFFGEQLKKHPLRIKAIEPEEAVQQISTTPHSTIVELKDSPVREFDLRAYGMIDGLAKLACCCAPLPSPPLPPPSPLPPPMSPSPPPASHSASINSEWGRGIQGRVTFSSPPPLPPAPAPALSKTTATTTIRVIASVALFGSIVFIGQKVHMLVRKSREGKLRTVIGKGGIPLVPKPKMNCACLNNSGESQSDLEMPITGRGSSGTTKLHIELSATNQMCLKVSLEGISTMDELQELVAEVCEEAGVTQLDDLVMAYKRPDGKFAIVTRSVTVGMLRKSPALRLAPAEPKDNNSKRKVKGKK